MRFDQLRLNRLEQRIVNSVKPITKLGKTNDLQQPTTRAQHSNDLKTAKHSKAQIDIINKTAKPIMTAGSPKQ